MRIDEIAIEAAGISIANKTMTVGAGTGLVGWAAQVNWVGAVGAAVAIVGLLANIFFQIRRDRREAELIKARIQALKDRRDHEGG